jgi:hypothetical protein
MSRGKGRKVSAPNACCVENSPTTVCCSVGIVPETSPVLNNRFKLLVRKSMEIVQDKNASIFFSSLLLTEDTPVVEIFLSVPHVEPSSERIIRVSATSIWKGTRRERIWTKEGKKSLLFVFCCCQRK